MEIFSSLFSSEDDAFLFQHTVPTEHPSLLQQTMIRQDLASIPAASLTTVLERNELINVDKKEKRQRKSAAAQEDAGNGSANDNQQKRTVHRDIERQRRQEMAKLFGSLRALLPLEYIKGKRVVCDQVNEAVNYIKYQEKNITKLQEKRDKLRNLLVAASDSEAKERTSRKSCPVEIRVWQCWHGGIEILISNELVGEEQFPLSSVLKVLVEERLNVVSYLCTKVNDEFLYAIETEASHTITGHDIHILLQKLSHRIKASRIFS